MLRRIGVLLAVACAGGAAVAAVVSPTARHVLLHGRMPPPPVTEHPLVRQYRPDGTTLERCERMPSMPQYRLQQCRARALGNVAYRHGAARAFADLRLQVARDSSWQRDVHITAHFIGAAELARRGDDVGMALASGSSLGGGGYYHGLMVQLLGRKGGTMPQVVRESCHEPAVARIDFTRIKCYHGAGHGFLVLRSHDLPAALELCERAATTDGESANCKAGVFMENIGELYGLAAPGFRSPWLDENDLEFPCNQVADRHRPYCYIHVASRAGPVLRWDWRRLAGVCARLPTRDNRGSCFQSIGLWASARTNRDPRRLATICSVTGEGQTDCFRGAVKAVVNDDPQSRTVVADATLICRASNDRRPCFESMGTILRKLGPAGHRRACARLVGDDRASCLRTEGASVSSVVQSQEAGL